MNQPNFCENCLFFPPLVLPVAHKQPVHILTHFAARVMFIDSWTIKQLYQKVSGTQQANLLQKLEKISKSGLTLGLCDMSLFQQCIHNLQMDSPVWLDWEGPGVWRWSPPPQTVCSPFFSSEKQTRQNPSAGLNQQAMPRDTNQTGRKQGKLTESVLNTAQCW